MNFYAFLNEEPDEDENLNEKQKQIKKRCWFFNLFKNILN